MEGMKSNTKKRVIFMRDEKLNERKKELHELETLAKKIRKPTAWIGPWITVNLLRCPVADCKGPTFEVACSIR